MGSHTVASFAWHGAAVMGACAALAVSGCTSSPTATPTATSVPTLASIQSAVVCPSPPVHSAAVNPPRRFSAAPGVVIDRTAGYCAYMATGHGVISIRLRPEYAPTAVNDFVFLATHGFYDALTFTDVCPDLHDRSCPAQAPIAVAGDPTGKGTGGPGYTVAAEPVVGQYLLGAVAMYGNDPATIGSQLLISKGDSRSLPHQYVIFGQVTDGIAVLASLQKGDTILWVAVVATPRTP